MNHICIKNGEVCPQYRKGLLITGGLLIIVSLIALAILLTLYYCKIYYPHVSQYLLFCPEGAGVLAGLITLAVALCLKEKAQAPQHSNNVLEPPNIANPDPSPPPAPSSIPLTQLIKGSNQTEMADKLSAHWLKDAATRIFHNPLRSFLELVVNSLDASVPAEKNVGKFGMGFISILTFLDHPETEGAKIQITTTFTNEEGQLTTYSMDLFKQESSYHVLFTDQGPQTTSGTTINIYPNKGVFSQGTLSTLFSYCQSLQFYEHGQIEISYQDQIYPLGEGSQMLAWITLKQDQINVKDQGCGISKEVARTKLFVPSISTKQVQKTSQTEPCLPEFKRYLGKQGQQAHFLISINGVIVIDLLIPGKDDLLLKMPPATRLTLARDALENCPETMLYLKKVIDLAIQNAKSKEGSSLLLSFYDGLKKWEELVPSMKAVNLVAYLHKSVEMHLHNSEFIPYPLEYAGALAPLLNGLTQVFPFPSVLLFDHFDAFENLIKQVSKDQHGDLISGKTVIFAETVTQVSAFGMKNLIFAPLSLLSSENKKLLQLSLVTQFVDAGKSIEPASSHEGSLLPAFLTFLRGPKRFVFLTGRNTPPNFKENSTLNPTLFEGFPEQPFVEFWEKHQQVIEKKIFPQCANGIHHTVRFPVLFSNEEHFWELLGWLSAGEHIIKQALGSLIVYEGTTYRIIQDKEAALNFVKEVDETLIQEKRERGYQNRRAEALAKKLAESDFKARFLQPISSAETSKLFFAWMFGQAGVNSPNGTIFTAEEKLWPVTTATFEYLQRCFQIFIEKSKPVISEFPLPSLHGQEPIWQILEPFMDYSQGDLAIQKVFPLLQFQEQLLKQNLSTNLQEKLALFVKQMVCLYHRFLTVKNEEISLSYGHSLPCFANCHIDQSEFECSLKQMVDLFSSLQKKPDLFEKCLNLLTVEMTDLLCIKERNKTFSKGHSPTLVDICFNNGSVLLSLAKAKGLDQNFIETIIHHAQNPFELYLISLLLLSDTLYQRFSKPDEKLESILEHVITIYFRKQDLAFLKAEKNFTFWEYRNINCTVDWNFRTVLQPLLKYLTQIEGETFEIAPQMIPEWLLQKLHLALSFTTTQIIHAALANEMFTGALQTENLLVAIDQVTNASKKTDLQIVTQAVEHGSERSGIESTLVEAFQNSADAVRVYLKKNPHAPQEKAKISFDVRLVGENKPQLLIEVADQIGMESLETLLADFLIPNYSKKEKCQEAVGEMGNGSYQMYRDAEMVTVQTRTLKEPAKVYFLRIIPRRDPFTREVIDLKHKCIDITTSPEADQFVGTTVSVLMRDKPGSTQTSVELEGLTVRNFIQQTFSVTVPQLVNQRKLECELKLPKGEIVPLDAMRTEAPFKITNSPFNCYKMQQDMTPGYVLTDGYPFKPLEIFLMEEKLLPPDLAQEVARGWCLILPKGSYEPVQSRTHVQIKDSVKKNLQFFLLEWIYFRSCYHEQTGPLKRYYPHFGTECGEFSQVNPYVREIPDVCEAVLNQGEFRHLEAFFVHYKPTFLQKNFLGYIQDGYETLVPNLKRCKEKLLKAFNELLQPAHCEEQYLILVRQFVKDCEAIEKQWIEKLTSTNEKEKLYLARVVEKWFSKKIENFIISIPTLEQLRQKNPRLQIPEENINPTSSVQPNAFTNLNLRDLLLFAKTILNKYCEIFVTKNAQYFKRTPQIRFVYDHEPYSGYYSYKNNEIVINLFLIPLYSIVEMGQELRAINIPKHRLITITPGSSGTLNHELEHARRGLDCTGNAHDRGVDVNGVDASFEACATSFAQNAYNQGLFKEWVEAVQSLAPPSDFSQLRQLEKKQPELLIDLLS